MTCNVSVIRDPEYPIRESGATYTQQSGRDIAGYFAGGRRGEEPAGRWQLLGSMDGEFAGIADGQDVHVDHYRRAIRGFHPETLAPMTAMAGQTRLKADGTIEGHVPGVDLTFSAPKSVSLLMEAARDVDQDHAAAINEAITGAALSTVSQAHKIGVFQTRRGKGGQKGREPAAGLMATHWAHTFGRSGDPQRHVHVYVPNAVKRGDGSWGALDQPAIFRHMQAMGGLYRAELARRLVKLGYAVELDDKGSFKVQGISDQVCEAFSKRRKTILAAADDLNIWRLPAAERQKILEALTLDTRESKDTLPPHAELRERHTNELAALGLTRADLVAAAREAGAKALDAPEKASGSISDGSGAVQTPKPYELPKGLQEAFHDRTVVQYPDVLKAVATDPAFHGRATPDEIVAEAERIAEKELVRLGRGSNGEPVYATWATIDRERRILANIWDRRHEDARLPPEAAAKVIDDLTADLQRRYGPEAGVSAEQAAAISQVVAGRGGVQVMPGAPGAGKSTALMAIKTAYAEAGYQVIGVAPSMKAVDIVRKDAMLEDAASLQGLARRIQRGDVTLTARTMLLIDEASMASPQDLDIVLRAARETNAKVLLSGDHRQFDAVGGAGSPFRAAKEMLEREGEVAAIETVRRQLDEQQRVLSQKMVSGQYAAALEQYDKLGKIEWHANATDTLKAAVDHWEARTRADLEAGELKKRLFITDTNAGVRLATTFIRDRARNLGLISGPEVAVQAISRDAKQVQLAIAVGDRLLLGERVIKHDLINGDDLTVKGISTQDGKIRLDLHVHRTGKDITVGLDDLVGYRKPDEPQLPKLQHGWARTTYGSQGDTVHETIKLQLDLPRSSKSTLVDWTRHREDIRAFVDASVPWQVAWQRHNDGGPKPTEGDMKKACFEAAETERSKLNVIDFIKQKDRQAWIETGRLPRRFAAGPAIERERVAAAVEQGRDRGATVHIHKDALQGIAIEAAPERQEDLKSMLMRFGRKAPRESVPAAETRRPANGGLMALQRKARDQLAAATTELSDSVAALRKAAEPVPAVADVAVDVPTPPPVPTPPAPSAPVITIDPVITSIEADIAAYAADREAILAEARRESDRRLEELARMAAAQQERIRRREDDARDEM